MSEKTDYEKGRIAIDVTAKNIKEHAEKYGQQITSEQAFSEARKIAERSEKRTEKRNK